MTDFHSTGLQSLLEQMEASGASDLHLKGGCAPGLRIDGKLTPIDGIGPLSPQLLDALIAAMTTPEQRGELLLTGGLEFALNAEGLARYRVSLQRQRGQTGAVLRRIPADVPNFEKLGLPAAAKKLCQLPRGLVLVTGAAGSGRSTTLAAMVDFINRERAGHIVTIENPIEFLHADQGCYVTQCEVGVDCDSAELALRRALRHDPDVIVLDELRDRELVALALTAVETGHLVLATSHATGVVQAVDRLIDAFPPDRHAEARGRVAAALQGVVSQALLPKAAGGRVAVVELMIANDAIRNCVRDGKTSQIHMQMQAGSESGMQTQAAALADLVFNSTIPDVTALKFASNLEELKNQLSHGTSPLRAAPRPAAPAASSAPRVRHTTPALPPWAVAPAAPGSPGSPAAPAGTLPKRPPLSSPLDPMQGRPGAPPGSPARPYVPRNPGTADPLEKLRRS